MTKILITFALFFVTETAVAMVWYCTSESGGTASLMDEGKTGVWRTSRLRDQRITVKFESGLVTIKNNAEGFTQRFDKCDRDYSEDSMILRCSVGLTHFILNAETGYATYADLGGKVDTLEFVKWAQIDVIAYKCEVF